MASSGGILTISIFLFLLALGMFGFTYAISPLTGFIYFRLSLYATRYACLWAGIPALITSIVGMVAGCNTRPGSSVAFMILSIITCLCSTAMALYLYFPCRGFCFVYWSLHSMNMYVGLILDGAVVAILTLVGSIVACCATCSCCNAERVDPTIQLQVHVGPETYPMTSPTSTAMRAGYVISPQANKGFAPY